MTTSRVRTARSRLASLPVALAALAAAATAATVHAAEQQAQAVAASPPVGTLQLVTTRPGGAAATVSSSTCAISADGSQVLFFSDASNLVAGDTNGAADLFLKNLHTGVVTRVSTTSSGAQLPAGGSCLGSNMTPDARVVAFTSGNVVYAKNTQTGVLTQASPQPGVMPQVTGFFGGVLSDDGSRLVFKTLPELVYQGAYNFVNVIPARLMLRHLDTGGLEVLATDNGITAQGEIVSSRFSISPDGTQVAFVSSSAALVPGDSNGRPDVFVRNLVTGGTRLVSSTSAGVASGPNQFFNPVFVSNSLVAFNTLQASGLGEAGLYLKDLGSDTLELVLSSVDGGADAVMSGDGRKVAYAQLYGSGWDRRIFVLDRATGQQTLASASSSGVASNGQSTGAVISRDGTRVAFGSNARNLISPRPPTGVFQIYAKVIGAAPAVRE